MAVTSASVPTSEVASGWNIYTWEIDFLASNLSSGAS